MTDETSPDFYGKRLPFIDPDKSPQNPGPESSALGDPGAQERRSRGRQARQWRLYC